MTYASNDPARWLFLSNAHLASYLIVVSFVAVAYDCINIWTRGAPHWNTIILFFLSWSEEVSSQSCTLCARRILTKAGQRAKMWCTLDNTYVMATEPGYSFDSPWGFGWAVLMRHRFDLNFTTYLILQARKVTSAYDVQYSYAEVRVSLTSHPAVMKRVHHAEPPGDSIGTKRWMVVYMHKRHTCTKFAHPNMTYISNGPALWPLVNWIQIFGYFVVASFAAVIYDWGEQDNTFQGIVAI
ncbi:hypothetical protein BDR05DRAFT_945900 [Suillus weaverae]|nr:hypothetical protein BDR05DRAFT_945900 [Suillus weaverae]